MVGVRFAEAGMEGRRNSVAEEGLGSEGEEERAFMGEDCSLCVMEGMEGGALFGA